jgi:hypothetical protein
MRMVGCFVMSMITSRVGGRGVNNTEEPESVN